MPWFNHGAKFEADAVPLDWQFVASGIQCVASILAFAALPWAALFVAMRRGAPLAGSVAGLYAGAAAFLDLFRVVNFAPVAIQPERLKELAANAQQLDLPHLLGNQAEVLKDSGPPQEVANAEAAGTAAALAAECGVNARSVDMKRLQERLRNQGVPLDEMIDNEAAIAAV